MVKLTKELLPEEKWKQMKGNLNYFYLIKQDLPCCLYNKDKEQIAILYDSKNSMLWLITDNEPHCKDFLNKLSNLSFCREKVRPGLICSAGMDLIIDEFYLTDKVL